MRYAVLDDFFSVLGNQQRVKILQYLSSVGARSVSDISKDLSMEQSAVSHNMKRLLECHFVEMRPSGKERIYSINHDTVEPLFKLIEEHVRKYCAKGCKHWQQVT